MELKKLMDTMPQKGEVVWIGIRPQKKSIVEVSDKVYVSPETGLQGDHYQGISGNRHVTLIQKEHIDAVSSIMNIKVDPGQLRRNLVVQGINLQALDEKQIQIGEEVILEVTGMCHPCSRMEENLGSGGYNAMRGHGGITSRVIRGGTIKLHDIVQLI